MIENTAETPAIAVFEEDYNISMRRLTTITALGTALLVSLSLQAQMRGSMGGRSSGGSRASSGFRSSAPSGRSFSGPSRGFSGPARGFAPGSARGFAPAPRSFAPRTFAPAGTRVGVRTFSPARRSFAPFPGRSTGFHRFHNRFFFRDRFFLRGCFGCFSPFFFGGGFFGDPFFTGFPGDYSSYGPPPPQPAPVVVTSDNSNDVQLAAEVQRLTDEVEDLRDEEARNRSDSRAASANTSITAKEPGLPVEFIFRDGRRISARNYAIAGQTLWILDEHAARKFSLADLDADATQQANAANGLDIHLPAAPAKQ